MASLSKVVRRTLIGIAVVAILLLGSSVFNPTADTTVTSSLVQLLVLAILAAGLIPGSYIQRMADSLASQAEERGRLTLIALATLGPFLLFVVFGLGVYNALDTLQFIGQVESGTFDERVPRFDLLRYSVLAVVSVVLFLLNIATVLKGEGRQEPVR